MNKLISTAMLAASLSTLAVALPARAADTALMLPIAAAMAANDAQSRLGDSVKFYFGDQPTPSVARKITSDKTSLRTNAFGKTAEKSCNWVFLSAMLALQKRANEVGADAVINIVSNFKEKVVSSQTEFECHEGAIMSGVALKGDFVKLAK
ncbi:excinuclease ATPase subunit [Rugamonas sp. CCM 8940]|uniref:excinuclease ATPase subunit n=1 Tax=Rugamonas sp. CCM 8940 TaxID=2765359 RepID=UPI0018F64CB9|nr:excinuclease ATPase subunit [Rugamonas sp. CCM 8940]MBJ7314060.1 excinuclease ATPase subunit [Rugamonas sp. CCM 8940]